MPVLGVVGGGSGDIHKVADADRSHDERGRPLRLEVLDYVENQGHVERVAPLEVLDDVADYDLVVDKPLDLPDVSWLAFDPDDVEVVPVLGEVVLLAEQEPVFAGTQAEVEYSAGSRG
jgi:hypothetical protein